MGIYDYRCLLTGTSLRGAKCIGIVLHRVEDRWLPASLPLRGTYNAYGTVEAERRWDDYIVEQMAVSFAQAVDGKRITLQGDAKQTWRRAATAAGITRVLQTIERTAVGHGPVLFDGQPVAHTLIQAPVFDAICAHEPVDTPESTRDLLQRVLPSPLGRWWYEDLARFPRADVQGALRADLLRIAALARWMREHEIEWSTPGVFAEPGEQHGLDLIIASTRAARKKLAAIPWLQPALEEVAKSLEACAYSLPKGWLTAIDVSWYAVVLGSQRIACTHLDALARHVGDELDPAALLGARAELLVIDRGDVAVRLDLRPFLSVRSDSGSATLDDVAACEEILTGPGHCELVLLPLEVPALAPPVSRGEPWLIVPSPPPPWVSVGESDAGVIPFDHIG